MGVSVPRINRVQPSSGMPQNDRINIKANDQASSILNRTEALGNIGEKGADIYQEYENDTIDTLADENEREYSNWSKSELARLKDFEGDPTDAYVEFDKRAAEKREEILNKRTDLNDRVKRHVTSRLDKSFSNVKDSSLFQRGMQKEVYDNNLFESSVKLKKDDLVSTRLGFIQKDDPSSFLKYDEGLADIKTSIAKQGMKKGTVTRLPDDAKTWTHAYTDDEGKMVKVNMTDIAKQRVAKELSEGVKTSIDVLIAGGQVEEAKVMQEKYKGYLDPVGSAKIQKNLATADRKTEAYKVVTSLKGKSEEAQIEALDNISDPELRSEALKIKDADDARLKSLKDRKAKVNSETLANHVITKMSSNQPYFGVADLENDPVYKQTWDNLDSKGKKAVLEMVQAPKVSNPKSEARLQDLFLGNADVQIENVTPEDFQLSWLTGLDEGTRKKYTNRYNQLRIKSASGERATYKQAGTYLRDQFLIDGHIQRDRSGNIRGDDEVTLLKAQDKLMDYLSTQTERLNEKQLKDFVKEYSVAEIKGKVFNPAPRTIATVKNNRTTANQDIKLSPQDLTKLKRQFHRENKYFPTKDDEKFKVYVQRNANR